MPFNKKVFENPFMPKIEKKPVVTFEEFNLSKSNTKLAKKTLVEYLNDKENTSQNIFRARSLDKKILETGKPDKSPSGVSTGSELKPRRLTEFSPFNFKTDERIAMR
jgi:5-methylcytosine-specific restriction endonuclease McrBC regulatory subunit McrC